MGDDAIRPQPGKSGCLKWTCGCLACAAVLAIAAAGVGWYLLSRWTPGKTGWENLPPDTVVAFEAHDVKGLMSAFARDEGAAALADGALRGFQRLADENGIRLDRDLREALREANGGLSWLYTLAFPNYVALGARGFDEEDAFAVVTPPKWFAWLAGAAFAEGAVEEIAGGSGISGFIAFRDGFVVAGLNEEIVRHVLDNWDAKAAPLGARAGRTEPYCMVALRTGTDAPDAADKPVAEPPAGDDAGPFLSGGLAGNFTLEDPFAAPAPQEKANAAARYQALALAGDAAWRVWFEKTDADAPIPANAFVGGVEEDVGTDALRVALPDASDLEVAARTPKGAPEQWAAALEGAFRSSAPHVRLGGEWLRGAWLGRAGGEFTLLASRPAANGNAPYPPMPVVGLGWNPDADHEPGESAVLFADALEAWMDALVAPGGPLPAAVAASIRCQAAADRRSGSVTIPPVLANGAKPVWKFVGDGASATGWMATDPSGVPSESVLEKLAVRTMPVPEDDRALAAANWDMSPAFIDATEALVADRVAQLPEGWFEGRALDKKTLGEIADWARTILSAYPKGAFRAAAWPEKGRARAKAEIPFGTAPKRK